MQKEGICTIITADYAHFALALHDSIRRFKKNISFTVLVISGELGKQPRKEMQSRGTFFILDEKVFEENEIAKSLKEKYSKTDPDAYRWSMKPVLMEFLLKDYLERVIYLDSDIYFFSDFGFLFEELRDSHILLSPHYRCSDPYVDAFNFGLNFLEGLYNGGFIGGTKKGIPALQYWASLCLYKCEKESEQGFYDDQRYLDILPVVFEGVNHIKHKGCNIANWNQIECKRSLEGNDILINGKYPIIFIHFTKSFFNGVLTGKDQLLLPYLKEYRDTLFEYSNKDIIEEYSEKEKFNSSVHGVCESGHHHESRSLKQVLKSFYRKLK